MGTTLLTELLVVGLVVLGLQECSPVAANEKTDTHRSLAHQSTQWTLVAGTLIQATTQGPLSSRRNKAGETLIALVSGDVEDADGQVVIPAGSRVALRIAQLEPATNKTRQDGKVALDVTSLTVRNQVYPVSIRVEPPHVLQGGGVTTGTAILFVLPQPLIVATRHGARPRW